MGTLFLPSKLPEGRNKTKKRITSRWRIDGLCEKTMEIYVGFDPGGDGKFGWAACFPEGKVLHLIATGRAGHAKEAVNQALSVSRNRGIVVGAGIDAPLFWTEDGGRYVDEVVRRAIQQLGAPYPAGTVQHFNSLQGACLVQGVLTAKLLHDQLPQIAITESHPKALLYLLGIASAKTSPASVTVNDLSRYVVCDSGQLEEHERDAVLAAITAFAQKERPQGWINLFERERYPVIPFNYQVSYWMPWSLVDKKRKAT